MNKQEESNAHEIKTMLQVRDELGWRKINDLIKWHNPGGMHDSLTSPRKMLESRNALGWGVINEFIKRHNPGGVRDSLIYSRYVF